MQHVALDEATIDPRILKQLEHLEKILWVGRPPSGITLRPGDILFVLSPIALVIFAAQVGGGIPAFLYLLPLFLVASLVLAKVERANTVYALTDRKVIIVGRLLGRHERILKLAELLDLTLDERSDGSGTIRFGGYWQTWISDLGPSTDKTPPRVEVGTGAREVFALFERARAAARLEARG